MKRIFISLTLLSLITFTSCKKTENAADAVAQESTEAVGTVADGVEGVVSEGSNAMGGLLEKGMEVVGAGGLTQLLGAIPQLKDATAVKTLTEYGGLVGKLIAASKTGSSDTASLQENVATKFQEVAKVIQTLSPEEKAKAMEWLTKLSDLVKK